MFVSVAYLCVCVYGCVVHTPKCVDAILFSAYLLLFSLDCVVLFFSFLFSFVSFVYTNSVLCTENADFSNVLLRVSFPISVHTGTTVVVQR